MNNTTTATHSPAKLQRQLALWHIIIIGLAYIQPMTVFDTFGLVSEASYQHVPTSYIIALIAILLTS
ncbi:putrescine/spermidine ABC transporter, partial [Salmonella enterica subsp. enterica serovar Enteritidis]|nr:putrescine/spermidine ABC transporter [Salmonella enterica subsp. enterica serovar Enteritidis]